MTNRWVGFSVNCILYVWLKSLSEKVAMVPRWIPPRPKGIFAVWLVQFPEGLWIYRFTLCAVQKGTWDCAKLLSRNFLRKQLMSFSHSKFSHSKRSVIDAWQSPKQFVKSVRIPSYSCPYFLEFGVNTERYGVSLYIPSERGKMQTRITSITDTSCTVKEASEKCNSWYVNKSRLSFACH